VANRTLFHDTRPAPLKSTLCGNHATGSVHKGNRERKGCRDWLVERRQGTAKQGIHPYANHGRKNTASRRKENQHCRRTLSKDRYFDGARMNTDAKETRRAGQVRHTGQPAVNRMNTDQIAKWKQISREPIYVWKRRGSLYPISGLPFRESASPKVRITTDFPGGHPII